MGRRRKPACTCPRGMRIASCRRHESETLEEAEAELRAAAEARLELFGEDDVVGPVIGWAAP